MLSTMDLLHQLSDSELCVMCHNYGIAARKIQHFDRRSLERRLHVAIIGERARLRAHNVIHRSQHGDNRMYDYGVVAKRIRRVLSWRAYENMLNQRRFEQRLYELEAREHQEHSENLNAVSIALCQYNKPVESELEQQERRYERQQQEEQKFYNNAESTHLTRSEHCYELTTTQKDNFSVCSSAESKISILVKISKDVNNELRKVERFSSWDSTDIGLMQKSDTDTNSEQELCTINYLSKEQVIDLNQLNNKVHVRRKFEDFENAEEANKSQVRQRPTLWSYAYELLWCKYEGLVDGDQLRYAILCCAVVAWVYIGVKMMQ